MPNKQQILKGREAIDAYRTAHIQLYAGGWHKGIPEEHTSLLEKMLAELKRQDLNSLDQFFAASEELNMQELGFASREDFEARGTDADRQALEGMWH